MWSALDSMKSRITIAIAAAHPLQCIALPRDGSPDLFLDRGFAGVAGRRACDPCSPLPLPRDRGRSTRQTGSKVDTIV